MSIGPLLPSKFECVLIFTSSSSFLSFLLVFLINFLLPLYPLHRSKCFFEPVTPTTLHTHIHTHTYTLTLLVNHDEDMDKKRKRKLSILSKMIINSIRLSQLLLLLLQRLPRHHYQHSSLLPPSLCLRPSSTTKARTKTGRRKQPWKKTKAMPRYFPPPSALLPPSTSPLPPSHPYPPTFSRALSVAIHLHKTAPRTRARKRGRKGWRNPKGSPHARATRLTSPNGVTETTGRPLPGNEFEFLNALLRHTPEIATMSQTLKRSPSLPPSSPSS